MRFPVRRAPMRVAALAALALVGGCTMTQVVVEMKPAGDGFERRLSAFEVESTDSLSPHRPAHLDPALAARLAGVYGVRADTTRPFAAARRFKSIPEDVGNWGRWSVQRSALGDTYRYAERLGGDPDPQATLTARLAAADSIAAWLREWSRGPSGPPPRSRLALWLERDFARELRNLAALAWARQATADTVLDAVVDLDRDEHAAAHDLWLVTADATARSVLLAPPADSAARALHRALLDDLEATLAAPGRSADAARDTLSARLERHGRSAPPADADSARWKAAHERLATWSTVLGGGPTSERLEVRLSTGVEPLESNGAWDPVERVVTWSGGALSARCGELPLACQARWAAPDTVRQRRLFGRVLLAGEPLATYCDWYAQLTSPRRAEWDRMLATLRPGDLRPLERFTFAGERPAAADSSRAGATDVPRRLILAAAAGAD